MQQLTPEQKSKVKKQEKRRHRERERREDEYRRRIERIRRQIEEARKRRQRMLLLFLLAVLAMQESILSAFRRSYIDWPDPIPDRDWTPDPYHDYAPRPGHDDYCDGYSYAQWTKMLHERGISREAERMKAWKSDPDYHLFPRRYREWGHRPYIGQIMAELTAQYWRADAFAALKLLTPHEVHTYLDEGYTAGSTFRQSLADRDANIINNFRSRAIVWEEHKKQAAEEARKAKNDKKPDDDEKSFDP